MIGQLIAMQVRMGSVFWREYCFFDRFLFWMRKGMDTGMVLVIIQVSFPVFAGPSFDREFFPTILRLMRISWWHNQ